MVFQFDRQRTILGTVFTHAGEEELVLSALDRMNHMLVIGKTGRSFLTAASATFALKAGVWFRRGLLLIVSPDSLGTTVPAVRQKLH